MGRFDDAVVLVTGGTTGIGLATAKAFLEEGAQVAITGQSSKRVEAAVEMLGDRALGVIADLADPLSINEMVHGTVEALGPVNVLFANAGIARFVDLDAVTARDFDELFAVNVRGPLLTIQRVAETMPEGGSIILTSSASHRRGRSGAALYAASKAALSSLTISLAHELMDRKIRVNAVSPGPVETPLYGKLGLAPEDLHGLAQQIAADAPMKRFGRAPEIADVVLFLASDEASFITGQDIVADGGLVTG